MVFNIGSALGLAKDIFGIGKNKDKGSGNGSEIKAELADGTKLTSKDPNKITEVINGTKNKVSNLGQQAKDSFSSGSSSLSGLNISFGQPNR